MNLLLALTLALATTPPSTTNPVSTEAAHIERLVLDGKADEAVTEGRPAAAKHPDDLDLRLAFARALAAKSRKVNRHVDVKLSGGDVKAGVVSLTDTDFRGASMSVDYDTALFDEAIAQLEYAIGKAPQRVDLRVFQCFLFTDAGKIDRARAAIESTFATISRSPYLAKTFTAYGAERAKRGDAAGAAELLAPVARTFPGDPAILLDYANALTRLGRKAEAYAAFDRATEVAPTELRYAQTKAVGAMLLRDYKRAQTAFNDAFRLSNSSADELASHVAAYGVDPKASVDLMKGLAASSAKSNPKLADLANAFARAAKTGASSAEAIELANTLMKSQQLVLAIPVLDRAVKANPNNAQTARMLKTVYKEFGCEKLAN